MSAAGTQQPTPPLLRMSCVGLPGNFWMCSARDSHTYLLRFPVVPSDEILSADSGPREANPSGVAELSGSSGEARAWGKLEPHAQGSTIQRWSTYPLCWADSFTYGKSMGAQDTEVLPLVTSSSARWRCAMLNKSKTRTIFYSPRRRKEWE